MFAPYTPIDKCVGKEITVRVGEENYTGMLAGIYTLHGTPVLVITPMTDNGLEHHIPFQSVVVTMNPV